MINKIKKFIKENCYYFIFALIVFVLFFIKFPYYIDAPGGIINVNDRIKTDEKYEESGSFNLAYVSEYDASLFTLFIAWINKDWEIIKEEDVLLDNETAKDYNTRDKLLMEESISNAINVAYTKSNNKLDILNRKIKIAYIYEESDTDLKVGDEILEVNNKRINSKEEIKNILSNYSVGDQISLKVKNNNKEYYRKAKLIEYKGETIIGVMIVQVNDYDLKPNIEVQTNKRESGPSGGLMLALSIYNKLTNKDITNNLTIVGTGTIDMEGNVGDIGGVEYKLKAAVKEDADLFIVPNGDNHDEAIKVKNENKYKIKIVGVSTFDEVIEYLNETK